MDNVYGRLHGVVLLYAASLGFQIWQVGGAFVTFRLLAFDNIIQ